MSGIFSTSHQLLTEKVPNYRPGIRPPIRGYLLAKTVRSKLATLLFCVGRVVFYV
jgi:hypothetical protein